MQRTKSCTPLLALAAHIAIPTFAASSLAPLENEHTIASYQKQCEVNLGFLLRTACLLRRIRESPNPLLAPSDPETRLFVLTARDLTDRVRTGRLSATAAEVELQRAYVDMKRREGASPLSSEPPRNPDWPRRAGGSNGGADAAEEVRRSERLSAQSEASRIAVQRQRDYDICVGIMLLRPNRSGRSGDGFTDAANCRSDPFAYLRDEARGKKHPDNSSSEQPSDDRRQGFLKGESISGLNKICYYSGTAGTYAKTISSTSLCPLSD